MPSSTAKNRLADDQLPRQINGFYIHSSPPKVFQVDSNNLNQRLKGSDLTRLENLVIRGEGHQLIGQNSSDPRVRYFLKQVPSYVNKINEAHEAAAKGDLITLEKLMKMKTSKGPMRNILLSRDQAGVGLLHKAVFHGHPDIVQFLISNSPQSMHARDGEDRTPLHYCGASPEARKIWTMLVKSGADPRAFDSNGKIPSYYMKKRNEISFPSKRASSENSLISNPTRSDFSIKPSNIRIWIHEQDLEKLQRVVWEGQGDKLLLQTSNNAKVKRFLEGVPQILNVIKDVHMAVINDDFGEFQKTTAHPVPENVLGSKDSNGLNPLHKAAGLGRLKIARNIVQRNRELVDSIDREGRTPLHFAAAYKEDESVYKFLLSKKANETALDFDGKSPAYYKNNPKELIKNLKVIPEAPRLAYPHPSTWDWKFLQASNSTLEKVTSVSAKTPEKKKVNENGFSSDSSRKTDVNDDQDTGTEINSSDESDIFGEREGEREENIRNKSSPKTQTKSPISVKEGDESQLEYYDIWTNNDIDTEVDAGDEKTIGGENSNEDKKKLEKEIKEAKILPLAAAESKTSSGEPEEVLQMPKEKDNNDATVGGENSKNGKTDKLEPDVDDMNREKTEWEIAEERQRLLDEGIIKVDCSDDDNEDGNDGDDGGDPRDVSKNEIAKTDDEVDQMIQKTDMQALASVVLEGNGEKLLGKRCENAEVQTFLDNVPSYMDKIAAVHETVRNGSVKELQTTLDRRKFATAKESSGELCVTPLHVAVLLQKQQMIKYLGGRFSETLNLRDNLGRTPLHYAAVVPDEGNIFNLLLNLGSDRRAQDDAGYTPSSYIETPQLLTYDKLLDDYDASTHVARDIFAGKENIYFGSEDGKYLADALGGPLIRGLTDVANKRPKDPIAHLADFLHKFLSKNKGASDFRGRIEDGTELHRQFQRDQKTSGEEFEESESDEEEKEYFPEEGPSASFTTTERDEFGQSILHFAAARSHGRTGLFQLIRESGANLGCRDELYRTARDVALQANLPQNINEIDKYVISLAAKGDVAKIKELYLEGYDHITDLKDEENESDDIVTVAVNKNQEKMAAFLKAIPGFEMNRERMHDAIRKGNFKLVRDIIEESRNKRFTVMGKNTSGRCSLHVAVLCQQTEITEFLAQKYPESLKIGDNLERTVMHYAMGLDDVEILTEILIKCGAERVVKDLKGRQPTYYFMNKSDILKLQEEESS